MELTPNNEFGEREEFKQVQSRKGYNTIGLFIAPDGYQIDQLREITKKATSWEDKIRTCHLPAQEAWQFLS